MRIVADLHIHSYYSRATSKELNFEQLYKWAQIKGVQVVGTGDITHPGWLQEIKEKLEPAEDGLFRLRSEYADAMDREVPKACLGSVRFLLSGEISSIYKKHDKVRKIHNVVFFPTVEAAETFQLQLEQIGNIRSDGRPILGLDSRDLLEMVLNTDSEACLIPAHIWTPWFSLFGSKSGFDRLEECFSDLSDHIFAAETGLSSDPPMNWRLSALDHLTLVSNSDAHSPQKLAREANLFDTELAYTALFDALKKTDSQTFLGTIEFFPEEGKYHFDGHRKCGIRWSPRETMEHEGVCPVCGKKVTVGVMHRVEELADRPEGQKPQTAAPFYSLIPLPELVSEVVGTGANSKKVAKTVELLENRLGSELDILMNIPVEEIGRVGGPVLAEGIRRMRAGEVIVQPGFDGEFGIIRVFDEHEKSELANQLVFFQKSEGTVSPRRQSPRDYVVAEKKQTSKAAEFSYTLFDNPPGTAKADKQASRPILESLLQDLNEGQRQAVESTASPLIIIAGPGTGKTLTLTRRIAYRLRQEKLPPEHVLAVTFTNKAAQEMYQRLQQLLPEKTVRRILIKTFHGLGLWLLRIFEHQREKSADFILISRTEQVALLRQLDGELGVSQAEGELKRISRWKRESALPGKTDSPAHAPELWRRYQEELNRLNALDYDDLLCRPVELLHNHEDFRKWTQQRFRWIFVDEFQDLDPLQYELLRLLMGEDCQLCVIGDPDQSIYGFRGASHAFFYRLQQDFPESQVIRLVENYRSSPIIIKASLQLIDHNPHTFPRALRATQEGVTPVFVQRLPSDRAEAEYVTHQIEKLMGATGHFGIDSGRVDSAAEAQFSFGEIAILFRLREQAEVLKEALERAGIPYEFPERKDVLAQPDVQLLLSALWFLLRPDAEVHRQNLKRKNRDLLTMISEIRQSTLQKSACEIVKLISSILFGDGGDLSKDVKKLHWLAGKEESLSEFLERITLGLDVDFADLGADKVKLLTLHAAKGLEFPVVFITGCEETLLPLRLKGRRGEVEEERRLFFVGMTRARSRLYLTLAQQRRLYGTTMINPASRFLQEVEEELLQWQKLQPKKKKRKDKGQLSLFD